MASCLVVDPVPEDPENEDSVEFFHVEGTFDSLQDVDVGSFNNAQNRSAIMMLASSSEGRSTIGVAHPERGVQLCLIAESELTEDARDVEKFTLSDLDGDGAEDLLAVARGPQRNRAELRVWTHEADVDPLPLRREPGTWAIPIPQGRRVCDLSTADFNGDGRRDVAVLLDSHDWSLVDDVIIGLNLKRDTALASNERRPPRYRFQFRTRFDPNTHDHKDRPRHCAGFVVHSDESPIRLSESGRTFVRESPVVDGLLTPAGEWIIADEDGRPLAVDYWNASFLHDHFDRRVIGSRIALSRRSGDNTQLVTLAWTDEDEEDGAEAMLMAMDYFQHPKQRIRYARALNTANGGPPRPPRALTVGALKAEEQLILVGFADGRIKGYIPDIYEGDLGSPPNQGNLLEQHTFDLLKPSKDYAKGPRDLELVGGLALGDIDKNGEIDIVVTSPEAASFSVIYFDPVEYF